MINNHHDWRDDTGYFSCSDHSYPSSVASSSDTVEVLKIETDEERREKNRKNSQNYNRKRKQREVDLGKLCVVKAKKVGVEKKLNADLECFLNEAYFYIENVFEAPPSHFIDEAMFVDRKLAIKKEFKIKMDKDAKFAKLLSVYKQKLEKHEQVNRDVELKAINLQTFGSRKSRTLHSKNIAEYELKVAEKDYELSELKARRKLLNQIHDQFVVFFRIGNTSHSKYLALDVVEKRRLDEIANYFLKVYISQQSNVHNIQNCNIS